MTAACGTAAAYRRHIRHGEDPCEPCRAAETRRNQASYSARRQRDAAKDVPAMLARREAARAEILAYIRAENAS